MKFFDKPIEKSSLKNLGLNHSPIDNDANYGSYTNPTIVPTTKLETSDQN